MYVNPFWLGVFATLFTEMLALFVYGIIKVVKK